MAPTQRDRQRSMLSPPPSFPDDTKVAGTIRFRPSVSQKDTKVAAKFSIGLDYGTNSVRAIIVDLADGQEIASDVYEYPSGDHGILLDPKDPNLARQNPADYIQGCITSVANAVKQASRNRHFSPDRVVGIGVDTTGSTPLPVDAKGRALALHSKFKKNLAAHAWLWKDHTSAEEAAEITTKASRTKENYLAKCGGTYSSEWFWSKILHCRRIAPDVFDAAAGWVELADFVPGFLTGNTAPETIRRGICAAGHKAMFHTDWGGLPKKTFLKRLDPELVKVAENYNTETATSDQVAGHLIKEFAEPMGLPAGIPVAVGAFDAHHGAIGSGVKPGTLVKIIGTSTCDVTVWPADQPLADIPGLCGIVPGSVTPGMYGLEAGQSAVGDIFNWFVRNLAPSTIPSGQDPHVWLTEQADQLQPGESGLLALDWNNGNRTVLVDPYLTGMLVGQTLHTTAAEIYRALIEATAFGALTIINRFEEYGVEVKQVVNCGGIAEKNPMAMQIYADVCGRPMKISRSAQTCALGAAIFGAVAGGGYSSVAAAQRKMTGTKDTVYRPRKKAKAVYAELYKLYHQLHDAFGVQGSGVAVDHVMKDLIAIRNRVRKG
ncbi:ribulokinase [Crateriforma conspicua]|uniref:Ribulokinase n=1 Tax=Crateriforma conspicua TaxID=2527996 RepID=A0A5C6FMK4_9PLAN|nr:ribulokinase [Crateriforma conspicua]TWU63277.1 Ribulokinase [Crateriforma conspicua]